MPDIRLINIWNEVEREPSLGWKSLMVRHVIHEFSVMVAKRFPPGSAIKVRAYCGPQIGHKEIPAIVSQNQFPRESMTDGLLVEVDNEHTEGLPDYRRWLVKNKPLWQFDFTEIVVE